MKIAIGGFQHETNTFAPMKADFAAFEQADSWPALQESNALLNAFGGMNIPISGFMDQAKALGHELVPLLWCSATPSGPVTKDAFERIAQSMLSKLKTALAEGIDAIYLDLHGAMVCEHLEDGEGELLTRIRALTGPSLPIIVSLDLHANISETMHAHADMLVTYRTYPHVDMAETGQRAAEALETRLREGTRAASAFRKIDFLIPLTASCTLVDPAKEIYGGLSDLERGAVKSVSLATGFSPADISFCGPSVLVYAAAQEEADGVADELARRLYALEDRFAGALWAPQAALAYVTETGKPGPFILADTQDNPGAGGNGDTVELLKTILDSNLEKSLMGVVYDPEVARAAHEAGEGAAISLPLGAKTGGAPEEPIHADWQVIRLSDAPFAATGPFYAGSQISLGKAALLRHGAVDVVVAERKVQCADQAMFTHLGAEPSSYRVVAVKSSVHFRADFEPIAEEVLVVASPGPNPADHTLLPYKRLRAGVRLMPGGDVFPGEPVR
jgi:microcystin degradation protein MlrC